MHQCPALGRGSVWLGPDRRAAYGSVPLAGRGPYRREERLVISRGASADWLAPVPCAATRVDVCVATYKRPRLLEKLLSDLRQQQLPTGVAVHVIVVDNDVEESARAVVAGFQGSSMSLEYISEPKRNIALARNRALECAQGDLVAFIDDD